MKNFIIRLTALPLLFISLILSAQEERHLCQNTFEAIPAPETVFQPGGAWFPYPAYTDRAGWDRMTGKYRDTLIRNAESLLDYTWQTIPASLYLTYEKTADRSLYKPLNDNTSALMGLLLGELAEGQGRFLSQIIDGMYYFAILPSWNGSGSESRDNIRGRMLPDPEYHVIALTSAARGALIATGLYFFHEEFDKVDPIISKLVYKSLESHIFDPYLDEFHYTHGHFWLGFGRPTVNNWNTYCNTYVLQAFLLADRDPDRLLRGISQCARSIDRYLDTNKSDGACNEGPSYWNMAAGKVYEYAHIMKECSGGRMDLLSDQQIRNLMGWRSKNYITDGWVVPFGDGYARDDGDKPLLYRLGSEMENPELVDLGIYMTADPARKEFVDTPDLGHDIYRALETLRYAPGFDAAQQAALAKAGGDWDAMRKHLREGVESFWYPQTEHAFLRTASGWFAGVKGGHNAESHNHNDVGSGLLYIGDIPVIIDPGVSTYWNSPLVSYHYWNHESQWHNLPTVNGAMQGSGAKFKAMGTTCDTHANLFRADIATAYPDSALIRKWDRTWSLKEDRLVITDRFKLSGRTRPTVENFITHGPVYLEGETVEGYLVKKGEAIIAARDFEGKKTTLVKLTFPKELIPYTEVRELDDPRFTRSWGSQIHRLQLEAPQNSPLSGTYTFTFKLL